ncbi:bud site selection protein 21-like [Gigantopelta aegis]|uniref:bud site selection protein 21-like n=1 Tax=Gigantopelta aegis TaxID=1735272 RepID=UPI001B88A0AB|nr:bud site selection protein 21-like [Gigantopelta aegis]
MGVTRASKKRLTNTRLKFDSDDDDFETPVFRNTQKCDTRVSPENSDEESEDNLSRQCDEAVDEEDADRLPDIETGEESDDVPDEITFSQSRESALTQINRVMQQIRNDNSQKKTKRKQQDMIFKQQKKKKLENFVAQKLPDDFLDSLPSVLEEKLKKDEKAAPRELDKESDVTDSETEDVQHNEDFIPLERLQGIEVVSLRHDKPKHKTLAQSAAEFRQSRLYGGKIPREDFQHICSRIEKRRVRRK